MPQIFGAIVSAGAKVHTLMYYAFLSLSMLSTEVGP
jgi:hypothetical protein